MWDKRKFNDKDIEKVVAEINIDWSIIDKQKGARSIEESSHSIGQNGYANEPIIRIPFHRVIVDMLHLFLRISDVLYDLFIKDLKQLDGKQRNELDFSHQPHLRRFFMYLHENFNIQGLIMSMVRP